MHILKMDVIFSVKPKNSRLSIAMCYTIFKYKNDGFDIIRMSLDPDEKRLRDYLKENDIVW